MESAGPLDRLAASMQIELRDRILPYWMIRTPDWIRGGFIGRITGRNVAVPDADRGGILLARILWTFSASHRVLRDAAYRRIADHAFETLRTRFWDDTWGGIYWMVAPDGAAVDDRKHVYAQAFALFGLSEYVRATGDETARRMALELFRLLEEHGRDRLHGGYFEAFSRAWQPLDDVRLSEKDENEPKSMNTHLHLMEAYSSLYRIWPDAGLAGRLSELVELFLDRIVSPDGGHLDLFFDADWSVRSTAVSYGHDIEASWLLLEAASVLDAPGLQARARSASLALAHAVASNGLDADGGLFNELEAPDHLDQDKHWWTQAEAIVGFVNAWELTGDAYWLGEAERVWAFVDRFVIDHELGEWFFRVDRGGAPYTEEDKVGPWKCPYHSSRACLEVMERALASHRTARTEMT